MYFILALSITYIQTLYVREEGYIDLNIRLLPSQHLGPRAPLVLAYVGRRKGPEISR
jgi:hypothetical protein